ncbi:hypothetical protein [Streptomyces sp. G45]|uniref:hypothetical protein n=1 Tax=Streptomyces sp. G45 TaxID=3406627 RepID=UPI003C1A8348
MAEVFLRRLTRWQAEQQRHGVANMYVECHGRDAAGFLDRFERHVQEPDFDMVTADSSDGLVGCLYGFRPERGGELHESVRGLLPADAAVATSAAGRLFLLVELMVREEYRGRGVATRMRDLLLARHGADVVVAGFAEGGQDVLRAWGCTKLGEVAAASGEAWLFPRAG